MCIKDRQWEAWYNGFKAMETSSYDGLNLAKKYSKDYVLAWTDYVRLWPQNKTYPESWLSASQYTQRSLNDYEMYFLFYSKSSGHTVTYQPNFFHKWNPSLPKKKQFLSISKLQTAQYSIWIMGGKLRDELTSIFKGNHMYQFQFHCLLHHIFECIFNHCTFNISLS